MLFSSNDTILFEFSSIWKIQPIFGGRFIEQTKGISHYIPMSQVRITDKRLIPQIKEYLEQSVGALITESDVLNYILQRFPESIEYLHL